MTISTDIYHRLHPIGVQRDQHFSLLQNNTNTGLLDIVSMSYDSFCMAKTSFN